MEHENIHAIVGRVKNLIAKEDIALSPVGSVLVNVYSMVLMDLHSFAEYNLPLPYAEKLKDLLRQKETLPLNIIQLTAPKDNDKVEGEYEPTTLDYEYDET